MSRNSSCSSVDSCERDPGGRLPRAGGGQADRGNRRQPCGNIVEFCHGRCQCQGRGAQLADNVRDIAQRRGTALARLFRPALLKTALNFGNAGAHPGDRPRQLPERLHGRPIALAKFFGEFRAQWGRLGRTGAQQFDYFVKQLRIRAGGGCRPNRRGAERGHDGRRKPAEYPDNDRHGASGRGQRRAEGRRYREHRFCYDGAGQQTQPRKVSGRR